MPDPKEGDLGRSRGAAIRRRLLIPGVLWLILLGLRAELSLEASPSTLARHLPQALPFLFGLFYRSPEALQAGVQGTGLGLYVVKLIAEAHGGSVGVESEPGQGTTVTVRLPLPEETR